ncbi:MAG TPA: DNA-directed RNA polymerase subunit alpha C-terminal domain-containing protein [Phycisphaerae bacterium]|nr:DNA-directed RNA polymerase subunit alpha C-terminal domain-containing protein [Phycisphaerae bacterium]
METTLDLGTILEQDTFDLNSYRAVQELGFAKKEAVNRLKELMAVLEKKVRDGAGDVPAHALKLGMCWLLLSDPYQAAQWLGRSRAGAQRSYFLGHAYREQRRYAESVQEFERAAQEGWDKTQCDCQRAESLLLKGEPGMALQVLESIASSGAVTADWHYARGRVHQELGEVESAIEEYEKALEQDREHAQAMFHLAFVLDLHGSDERALQIYEACTDLPFVHIHALMNLAVIYEDRGDYEKAARCLRHVLDVDPNNPRAQLYLKDVLAAGEMYIDELQVKEDETRNAVLDIPVTDFELSVRSRNCLKKMNIHTLGDLLRTTEEELLAYKNFGETSLREIKAMLAQKGLLLGQEASDKGHTEVPAVPSAPAPLGDPEVLARPTSSLQLSVRSRKCLQTLAVATLGELVCKTEAELLSSRNFGQTSLNEIKSRLSELGLALRSLTK